MEFLSADECRRRCAAHGIADEVLAAGRGGHYRHCLEAALPENNLAIIGVVLELLAELGAREQPCLLWLRTWDIWSEEAEALGGRMWERLIAGMGASTPGLGDARGAVFTPDAVLDLGALLTTVLLFQWDAVFVPDHGELLLTFSHDGYIRIATRSEDRAAQLRGAIDELHPCSGEG